MRSSTTAASGGHVRMLCTTGSTHPQPHTAATIHMAREWPTSCHVCTKPSWLAHPLSAPGVVTNQTLEGVHQGRCPGVHFLPNPAGNTPQVTTPIPNVSGAGCGMAPMSSWRGHVGDHTCATYSRVLRCPSAALHTVQLISNNTLTGWAAGLAGQRP